MNLKIFTDNIEDTAKEQIDELSTVSTFDGCKVRIMPDVHAGKGCVIGFTSEIKDAVIPNLVGVDIGCGVHAVHLGNIDIKYDNLDEFIKSAIPSGYKVRDERIKRFDLLMDLYCYRELSDARRIHRSLGTLGGGNHFIEVDIDSNEDKWLLIHTGSRNLGKQVAEYYQGLAIELAEGKGELFKRQEDIIKTYKEQGRRKEIQSAITKLYKEYKPKQINLNKELCSLKGKYKDMYLHDMKICQQFAAENRYYIAKAILSFLNIDAAKKAIDTPHNYIDHDNIVRKGAVPARKDELLTIPLNMKDGALICKGKGNEDWNCSAPHGAGRLYSRANARKAFKLEDFKQAMEGIYSSSICEATIDESPFAYKDAKDIISKIEDTVEILNVLKPVYNFKAH